MPRLIVIVAAALSAAALLLVPYRTSVPIAHAENAAISFSVSCYGTATVNFDTGTRGGTVDIGAALWNTTVVASVRKDQFGPDISLGSSSPQRVDQGGVLTFTFNINTIALRGGAKVFAQVDPTYTPGINIPFDAKQSSRQQLSC